MLNLKEKAQIGKGTNIFNIWFKLFRKGAIQSGAPLPGLQKFRQETGRKFKKMKTSYMSYYNI